MTCSVCYGKGRIRGGRTCVRCDGIGYTSPSSEAEKADYTHLGTLVGIVVGVIVGLGASKFAIDGMALSDTDGQKGVFLLFIIFSFVFAGFIGGGVSAAISNDNRTLSEHMQLPGIASFLANFTACSYGISTSF